MRTWDALVPAYEGVGATRELGGYGGASGGRAPEGGPAIVRLGPHLRSVLRRMFLAGPLVQLAAALWVTEKEYVRRSLFDSESACLIQPIASTRPRILLR